MTVGKGVNATRFQQNVVDMNSTAIRNKTFTQEHVILARKRRRIRKSRV